MSSPRTSTLEVLPNELQIIILKYLSLHDCYHSFFDLSRRYNSLVKDQTAPTFSKEQLDHDIALSGILISDYWVWNDTFLYSIVPRLLHSQPNVIQWVFL